MHQVRHLFATRRDLERGLAAIEEQRELQYFECASSERSEPIRHDSLLLLPHLGVSTTGSHLTPCFLVLSRGARVQVRSVLQRGGGMRYIVDQSENPGSIVLQPGGVFKEQALVAGHIGTIHDDPAAQTLFRDFSRTLTRGFEKVRSYYVGPEALTLLDSGFRLVTMSHDEPLEYDLAR